jgi:hypothetical protein
MSDEKAALEAAALTKIQNAHQLLQDAKVEAKDARKEAKDTVDAATAHLKGQVEQGVPQGTPAETANAVAVKLQNIELAWQNFEEAKAGAKELRKAARDGVNAARQHLAQAVKDSKQLQLPGMTP